MGYLRDIVLYNGVLERNAGGRNHCGHVGAGGVALVGIIAPEPEVVDAPPLGKGGGNQVGMGLASAYLRLGQGDIPVPDSIQNVGGKLHLLFPDAIAVFRQNGFKNVVLNSRKAVPEQVFSRRGLYFLVE